MRNRATVRVCGPLLLERLFGREFAQRLRLDVISSEADLGDSSEPTLVLHISGAPEDVPEGDCSALFNSIDIIGGRATVFAGLQARS